MSKTGYNLSKITHLREINRLSKTDVADLLELTVQGYSKKESGQRKFTLIEAKKLSELFSIPIEELFFNNNSNHSVNKDVS